MRRLALVLIALGAVAAAVPAEAQPRRLTRGGPLVLEVRPRSFLDAGTVVATGSIDPGISGRGQTQQYLLSPPYIGQRDRFGGGVLPDPITNGPFVGARNPFGRIDYSGQGLD